MSRKLTVVQLLPALESGGVERSTIEIADALVRAGHRAIVVSAGGRLLPTLQATGAEHVALDIGRKSIATLRHVGGLRRLFVQMQADVVHARSRLPAWIGHFALQGIAARRPHFVTTVHGLNSPSRYSAIMARGERVICVSQTVRDYVLQHYPATDAARLRVIPRGIDAAAFPRAAWPDRDARARVAALHPQLAGDGPLLLLPGRGTRLKGHVDAQALLAALRGDGPLLLLPGRGTRLKGHADALALLAALRGDGLDARLWMPGAREATRGDYMSELERQATALGIADAVAMTPPTAAIADAYAASDLVLQLSRKPESFGRTVIEALAVGRPVLGWAHGGVGELLQALQPQGAVVPFDADALARVARTLLAQAPALAVTMPVMRHDTMLSGYSLQAMQDATLACYTEIADDRSADDRPNR